MHRALCDLRPLSLKRFKWRIEKFETKVVKFSWLENEIIAKIGQKNYYSALAIYSRVHTTISPFWQVLDC